MDLEDFNSIAIGMHTNLHESSITSLDKHPLETTCSLLETQLTQASRTTSNHLSTPNKSDQKNNRIKWINNLSYRRKKQLRELKNYKPTTLPPLTKKIKKKLDLGNPKSQVGNKKLVSLSRTSSVYQKNINPSQLTLSQKVILYDWLLQSCEGLKLSRTVFYLSVSLIQKVSFFDRTNAQLVATSCLYLQNVMDDRCSRPIQQFEQITQGFVSTSNIKEYQLKILKDQDWKIPRITLIDEIHNILEQWDKFVLESPKIIIPEKTDKCMFLKGKKHIQNYIQFMAIVDSLKVMSIANDKNICIVIYTLLTILLGLELGYSTIQKYLPYEIVQFFVKTKFNERHTVLSPKIIDNASKKMYRSISCVLGILIASKQNVIEHVQQVTNGTKEKFQFLKQFYFDGMIPK